MPVVLTMSRNLTPTAARPALSLYFVSSEGEGRRQHGDPEHLVHLVQATLVQEPRSPRAGERRDFVELAPIDDERVRP